MKFPVMDIPLRASLRDKKPEEIQGVKIPFLFKIE
jgi:hypothetical protein